MPMGFAAASERVQDTPQMLPWLLNRVNVTLIRSFLWTYTKIGTIQRRLAWPLRKDDTQIREAFQIFILFAEFLHLHNTSRKYSFFVLLVVAESRLMSTIGMSFTFSLMDRDGLRLVESMARRHSTRLNRRSLFGSPRERTISKTELSATLLSGQKQPSTSKES